MVHRCRVSSTCICGLLSRSRARWTLTRALARAARAEKSGTAGDIRSGRAAKSARNESSLRASSSLLSARIRDISPTLPPAGLSCPAPAGHAVQDQEEHQQERNRQPVQGSGGDPGRSSGACEGQCHDCSHRHEGKHGNNRCADHQWAPVSRGCHAGNANSRAAGGGATGGRERRAHSPRQAAGRRVRESMIPGPGRITLGNRPTRSVAVIP